MTDAEQAPEEQQPAFRPRRAATPDPLLVARLLEYRRDLLAEKADRLADKAALLRQIAHLWFGLGGALLLLAITLILDLLR